MKIPVSNLHGLELLITPNQPCDHDYGCEGMVSLSQFGHWLNEVGWGSMWWWGIRIQCGLIHLLESLMHFVSTILLSACSLGNGIRLGIV